MRQKLLIGIIAMSSMVLFATGCQIGNEEKTSLESESVSISQENTEKISIDIESDNVDERESESELSQELKNQRDQSEIIFEDKGDTVLFGTYEQDNNTENGMEPIEWLVLERQENQILIVSKYVLDNKPYLESEDRTPEDVTWESSSIRGWLNQDFYTIAFTEKEKAMIPEVMLENPDNEVFGIEGGNDTLDKVFLLSEKEAILYFDMRISKLWYGDLQSDAVRTSPTEYAIEQGAVILREEDGLYVEWEEQHNACEGNCIWWLRTPGKLQSRANNIYWDGRISERGDFAYATEGIRPALWIAQ